MLTRSLFWVLPLIGLSLMPVVGLCEVGQSLPALVTTVALEGTGDSTQPAVPDLILLLKDPDVLVRNDAARALGDLEESAQSAIPDLLLLLSKEPESWVRRTAIYALGSIGRSIDGLPQSAIPDLLLLLKDRDFLIRELTAYLLVGMETPERSEIPALIQFLRDPSGGSDFDRRHVFEDDGSMLYSLRDPSGGSDLDRRHVFEDDSSMSARARRARSAELGLARSPAAIALGKMGEAAIPALIPLLKDPDSSVRSYAIYAFMRMGKPAQVVIPELIPLLQDPDEWVRQSAAETLEELGYQL